MNAKPQSHFILFKSNEENKIYRADAINEIDIKVNYKEDDEYKEEKFYVKTDIFINEKHWKSFRTSCTKSFIYYIYEGDEKQLRIMMSEKIVNKLNNGCSCIDFNELITKVITEAKKQLEENKAEEEREREAFEESYDYYEEDDDYSSSCERYVMDEWLRRHETDSIFYHPNYHK